ncbi:hypothetical protein ONE63_002810 [Megalurothrips usitatus]|uniref:Uncharacterized protein n=1 Tax=Megalurothrips usitatus TaxID=439358 RepID=A0AAV7X9L3_9NEOP|nr:hypothetical protein ONE63_002810 [Megalurothrips usitatus]
MDFSSSVFGEEAKQAEAKKDEAEAMDTRMAAASAPAAAVQLDSGLWAGGGGVEDSGVLLATYYPPVYGGINCVTGVGGQAAGGGLGLNTVSAINELNGISVNGLNGVNGINGINGINSINMSGLSGLNGVSGLNGPSNGLNGVNGLNSLNGLNGGLQNRPFGPQLGRHQQGMASGMASGSQQAPAAAQAQVGVGVYKFIPWSSATGQPTGPPTWSQGVPLVPGQGVSGQMHQNIPGQAQPAAAGVWARTGGGGGGRSVQDITSRMASMCLPGTKAMAGASFGMQQAGRAAGLGAGQGGQVGAAKQFRRSTSYPSSKGYGPVPTFEITGPEDGLGLGLGSAFAAPGQEPRAARQPRPQRPQPRPSSGSWSTPQTPMDSMRSLESYLGDMVRGGEEALPEHAKGEY